MKVSSGQEERVRETKELGSLPHTPASDPGKKGTKSLFYPDLFFNYPSANRSGQKDNPEIQYDNVMFQALTLFYLGVSCAQDKNLVGVLMEA